MDKSKKFDSLAQSQVVYEYISALPFKDAVRKIAANKNPRLRFDSFEETEDSSIFSIVAKSSFLGASYGYQLRLKPWNFGEQSHVALHKVDYHHIQIDYDWIRLILRTALLIIITSLGILCVTQTAPLPILIVIILAIPLLIFSSNEKIGRLAHSPRLEELTLEIIMKELGAAPDDNIVDENDAQFSSSGSSDEIQAQKR